MRHEIAHTLDLLRVRVLLEEALATYRVRYEKADPRLIWLSETRAQATFRVRGKELTAEIELLPGCCAVELDVPLLFRPFQDLGRRAIDREVGRWLTPQAR